MAGKGVDKGKDTGSKTGNKNKGTLTIPKGGGKGSGNTESLPKSRNTKDPFKKGC